MNPTVSRFNSTGKFTPVYVFYGEDEYSIHRAKDDLIYSIENAFQKPSVSKYNAKDVSFQEILAEISTVSMFSNTRAIVVDDFQEYNAKMQDDFAEVLLNGSLSSEAFIPDDTFVIIMSMGKSLPLKKANQKSITSIEFKKKYEKDAIRFVIDSFKLNNLKVEISAAEILTAYLGTDFQALQTEIEKIVTYVGGKSDTVSMMDVEKVTSKVSIESVFELCDSIAYGSKEKALEILKSLMYSGETAQMVQGMLASHIRALIQARDLIEDGKPENVMYEELSKVSKSSFRVKKFIDQARRVSKKGLKNAISKLSEVDFVIKKGQMAPNLAMELAVLNMAGNIRI